MCPPLAPDRGERPGRVTIAAGGGFPQETGIAARRCPFQKRRGRAEGDPNIPRAPPRKEELSHRGWLIRQSKAWEGSIMDGIIYLVGLIVIVMAILSFFGLH